MNNLETIKARCEAATAIAERLRGRNERFQDGHGNYLYYGGSDSVLDCEAADSIEAQAAEITRLQKDLSDWRQGDLQGVSLHLDAAMEKITRLQTDLAEAREALATEKTLLDGWKNTHAQWMDAAKRAETKCTDLEKVLDEISRCSHDRASRLARAALGKAGAPAAVATDAGKGE